MNRALLNPFEASDLPKSIQDYLELDAGRATCIRFNRHGNLLAVGTSLGSVVVFDFDTHTVATTLPPPAAAAAPAPHNPPQPPTDPASAAPAPPAPAPPAAANPVSAVAFPAPGNASAVLVAHRSGLLRLFDTLSAAVQTELSCPFSIHALDAHPRDPSVAVLTPLAGFPHLVRLRRGRYTLPQTVGSDDDDDDDDGGGGGGNEGDEGSYEPDEGRGRGRGRGRGGARSDASAEARRRARRGDARMQVELDMRKLRIQAPSCATPEQPHFGRPKPPPSTQYANRLVPEFGPPATALRLAPLRAPCDPPRGDPAPKQHHLAKRRWPAYAVALTRDGRYALRTGPSGLIHVFRLHGVALRCPRPSRVVRAARRGRGVGGDAEKGSQKVDVEKEEVEEEDGDDNDVDNGEGQGEGDTAGASAGPNGARGAKRRFAPLWAECVSILGVPGSAFIRSLHLAPRKPILLVVSADKMVRQFSLSQILPTDRAPGSSSGTDARNGGAGNGGTTGGTTNGGATGNASSSSVAEVEEVALARPDGVRMLLAEKSFAEVVTRSQCSCAVLSRDGEFVLGGMDGADHRINIWRMNDGHMEMTLEGPKEGIVELLWHPLRPVVASLGMAGGGVYVWAKNFSENWSAFATQFAELEANEEYVEREDEFDIVDEDDAAGAAGDDAAKAECADVDVERVDAAWFESDSDDGESFFYVPAVPRRERDDPAELGLADKIIMARMGAKERGLVIDINQGGKVTKKKRVRGAERTQGRPRKTRSRAAATAVAPAANGAAMSDVNDADAEGESERDGVQEISSGSGGDGDEPMAVCDG